MITVADQLSTPRIRIVMSPHPGAVPDVDEGVVHEFRALNMEMVAFDRERARNNWPGADAAPMLWVTYLAWRAATRLQLIAGMSQGEFEAAAWQVEIIQDESTPDGLVPVDPTQPTLTPG
jgi:hypothetical protein